jgi:hypothetical protein
MTKSLSTLEIGSASDTRDACANHSVTATNAQDPHTNSPAPQQPINQGAAGQLVFPRVDSA